MSMPPTTTPMITIMMGSSTEVSALTLEKRLQLRYEKFRRMGEEGTAFVDKNKSMLKVEG